MRLIRPSVYLDVVKQHFQNESQENIIPFILNEALHMIEHYMKTQEEIQQQKEILFEIIDKKLAATEN